MTATINRVQSAAAEADRKDDKQTHIPCCCTADGVPAKESLTQPKAGKPKFCQV